MAHTVHDCALMLETMAGPDGLDPRQHAALQRQPYTTLLKAGGKGLRIGILKEGFGLPDGEKDVDALVLDAAHRFERAGAVVSTVSVKEHTTLAMDCLNLVSAGNGPDCARLDGHELEGPLSDRYGRVLCEASARSAPHCFRPR